MFEGTALLLLGYFLDTSADASLFPQLLYSRYLNRYRITEQALNTYIYTTALSISLKIITPNL